MIERLRSGPVLYFVYALLCLSVPLSWPLPPADLVLLATSRRPLALLGWMVAIDVVLGQPQALWRWAGWVLLVSFRERYPLWVQPLTVGALSLLWYVVAGPAYSGLAGLTCAVTAAVWANQRSRHQLPRTRQRKSRWGLHE